jgi:hypothetical protein
VGAEQERRTGDVIKCDDPAGDSAREQENPRVRGEVGIANPFGSVVSSQGSTKFSSSYPRESLNRYHHKSPRRLLLQPSSTHGNSSWQTSSSSTESRHHRAFLFTDPIATGIHFPRVLLHNQGYPKVCPDSLYLLNAGNFFAGISSLTTCYLFSRTRDSIALT